jgi:ParB family chromosome partitioning protein
MVKKRGLGKGLDALLGIEAPLELAQVPIKPGATDHYSAAVTHAADNATVESTSALSPASSSPQTTLAANTSLNIGAKHSSNEVSALRYLPIEFLQPGQYQPRQQFDGEKLQELADSIATQGLMQPIVVRPLGKDRYEIIAGERRWRASQLTGLPQVPCWVRVLSDETALIMALIENMQREDLNPLEQAQGLKRLQEEFQMTHQQLAQAVGKSRVSVSNLLRLNQLPRDVKQALQHNTVDMGHARALLGLPDHLQSQALQTILNKKLTVRKAEQLVRQLLVEKSPSTKGVEDANIRHLQQSLSDKLGAKVSIQHQVNGRGKLLIQYTTLEELEGILGHIH